MKFARFCLHSAPRRLFVWGILLASIPHFSAQNPTVWCDVLNFQSEGQPFVEVHLEFESSALTSQLDSSGWRTQAEVKVILESENTVAAFGKADVIGVPDSTEELSQLGTQFHLERLQVKPGTYRLSVSILDAFNSEAKATEVQMDLRVPDPNAPQWSDPFLVGAYAASNQNEPTSISRSGYDMLPLVGGQFSVDMTHLPFYAELYHADEVVDSLFLMSSWMESRDGMVHSKTKRYFRKTAGPIVPFFSSIPLDGLDWSNSHNLVIQAATRDNQIIAEKRLAVQPLIEQSLLANPSGIPPYIAAFTDSLTLLQHIKDHHPLGAPSEQQTIDLFMEAATVAQMQAFLSDFWLNHTPINPEQGWRSYVTAVAYSDSVFGACRNGHGAMTDMGYVYLRYGPPNTIVKRHNGTDYYPYEIWHYHRAGSFTNKRFLFFSPHMIAECFALLHSDMLGEVQNNDWLHILRNRENSLRVTESQINRLNPRRDTFSGEEPEDLFFNPR